MGFKNRLIKRGIDQRLLTVDNKPILISTINVSKGQEVKFQGQIIDLQIPNPETKFDKFVSLVLDKCLINTDFDKLSFEQKNKLNAFIIEYFSIWGYDVDELSKSVYNQQILSGLEEFYKREFSNIIPGKNLKKKELVESLMSYREKECDTFAKLVSNI